MMKANGFEILLVTSLNKFGGSSSILCAFLLRSFFKHYRFLTVRKNNFWVVRIGKFFGLFLAKSFIRCRIVAILEKNWPNPLAMVSLFNVSSSFTLNVVLVSFNFGLVGNILFSILQNAAAFLVFSSSRFLLKFCLALLIWLLTLFLWRWYLSYFSVVFDLQNFRISTSCSHFAFLILQSAMEIY